MWGAALALALSIGPAPPAPDPEIAFIGDPPRPVPRGYQLTGVMSSLNQRSTRQDLSLSFIVFDLEAVEGLSLVQIADHAAMRAFARTGAMRRELAPGGAGRP